MKMPAVEGIIERRLLVNYRVAPGALARIIAAPFRPTLVAATPLPASASFGVKVSDLAGRLLRASYEPVS